MDWRLNDTDLGDPYFVTAADEAISILRKQNRISDTLHFYRRNKPTISVGRSRKIEDDINLDMCKKNNVEIVRRSTGGGTIFTDEGCLIYSLIFDRSDYNIKSPNETFEKICNCLISSLSKLNIKTVYKPPNDVMLDNKKISGSAQILKDNIVMIHGTILFNSDIHLMNSVLKLNKPLKVTNILDEIKYKIQIKDIKFNLKKEFELLFDTEMKISNFSDQEISLINSLLDEKYHKKSWNYVR